VIRRAYRGVVRVVALGFLAIVLSGVLPVTPFLYRRLVVADPPRRADAVVVLGGGILDEDSPGTGTTIRLVHGLRLHHRGYAPLLILTGGNPVTPEVPESAVMARVARELGTPADVLVLERVADRTATQGEAVARLARARGVRTILLVTSPEHSYRAARVFRKTGLEVISTPVDPRRFPRGAIAFSPPYILERICGLVPIAYEYAAIALYWWRGWL
jgi:uncharacterized SAM-binding protein YcdF (DUF218 family)